MGLGLFIFDVVLTFGIVAHYCVGARWPTGALFMQNITLWACPWTLSVAAVQAGGLQHGGTRAGSLSGGALSDGVRFTKLGRAVAVRHRINRRLRQQSGNTGCKLCCYR